MSLLWPCSALIVGLVILVFSADLFVDGAASFAKRLGMSPLLIGMVIVGFGTSAPEMLVSALASFENKGGLALGNAYGSNIANIALILGLTALIRPIPVTAEVLRKSLPILMLITLLAVFQLSDTLVSRWDAAVLLGVFALLMVFFMRKKHATHPETEPITVVQSEIISIPKSMLRLGLGLGLLIFSSQILVWGAVAIAENLGVSDLIIGLTIVALGTSLPELASSLAAARRGEHELALGNILGSNLFNTLVVVGISAMIRPIVAEPELLIRDMGLMTGLTASLFLLGYGFRKPGNISRMEGAGLILVYCAYTAWLVRSVLV